MATKKPLRALIPDILAHINNHQDYLQFNQDLYEIWQGQVKEYVKDSLREEIISEAAYKRAIKRIPSINVIQKTTQKLSKVYTNPPKRLTDNTVDMEIMGNIEKHGNLNQALDVGNNVANLHKGFYIEPFIENKKIRFRTLAYQQFLPFSDDSINPLNMTVLIKLLGKDQKVVTEQKYDSLGNKLEGTEDQIREVDLYSLTSDNEFMVIDSQGDIRLDKMQQIYGSTSTVNKFGVIPGRYYNTSSFELVPYPNQAGYDISILIPKLLTDLNFAAQYMSHSIIWTKNADLGGQDINPDAVIDLGDRDAEGGDPEMGIIDPKVDIEKILMLVEFELSAYFSSVGIKTSTQGSMMPGREASGFAKAMDEGDATQERQSQVEQFRDFEHDFWTMLSKVQNVWAAENKLDENRKFGPKFADTFSVNFSEMKVLKTQKQKLEEIKMSQDQGLMSERQALRFLYPDFTEPQLDAWQEELDKEKEKKMDEMLAMSAPMDGEVPKSNETRDEQESQRKETMGE
jgi:hypothetical protein